MGLQTPSAHSVPSLTPPLGNSILSPTVSICLCICQALAETAISGSCQQALLACTIVSVFSDCMWDGFPRGSPWMAFPSVSAPHFVYIFAPVSILFPFLWRTKAPTLDLPSSWASCGLWIMSWEFWGLGLISTYQWIHTVFVPLWLSHLTQDDILKFHPFACDFHEVIVFNDGVVLHCINVPHFLYPFFCWGIFGLCLASGYYE